MVDVATPAELAVKINSVEVLVEQQKQILELQLREQQRILQEAMGRQQDDLLAIRRALKVPSVGVGPPESCISIANLSVVAPGAGPCQACGGVGCILCGRKSQIGRSGTSSPVHSDYSRAPPLHPPTSGHNKLPQPGGDPDSFSARFGRSVSPELLSFGPRRNSPTPSEVSVSSSHMGNKMRPFMIQSSTAEVTSIGRPANPIPELAEPQLVAGALQPEAKLVESKSSATADSSPSIQHARTTDIAHKHGVPVEHFRKKHRGKPDALQMAQGWKVQREGDEDDQPDPTGKIPFLIWLEQSSYWNIGCIIVIFISAMCNGIDTDVGLKKAVFSFWSGSLEGFTNDSTAMHNNKEFMACVFMLHVFSFLWLLAEIALRAYVHRNNFFHGSGRVWNIFDCLLVGGIVFQMMELGIHFGFLRMLRIFRLVRAVRVLRLFKHFQMARKMFVSIQGSLNSLFWMFVFLFIINYFTSVVIMQGIAMVIVDAPLSEQELVDLINMFGTVPNAIYSLFASITGGQDWCEVVEPLMKLSPVFLIIFLIYLIFVVFGVLNVLTGVFVNVAMTAAKDDRQTAIQTQLEEEDSSVNRLRSLFLSSDSSTVDSDGTINQQEFDKLLEKHETKAHFKSLDINIGEAHGLFELLDTDGSGEIGIDEFVSNCMRLKGEATAVDVVTLIHENKKLAERIKSFKDGTEDALVHIAQEFKRMDTAARDNFKRLDYQISDIKAGIDHFRV